MPRNPEVHKFLVTHPRKNVPFSHPGRRKGDFHWKNRRGRHRQGRTPIPGLRDLVLGADATVQQVLLVLRMRVSKTPSWETQEIQGQVVFRGVGKLGKS